MRLMFTLKDASSDAINKVEDGEKCLIVVEPGQPPRLAVFTKSAYMHWHDGHQWVRAAYFARLKDARTTK